MNSAEIKMNKNDFDVGDVGSLANGFFHEIFDKTCRELQDRQAHPEKGDASYLGACEIFEKFWEQEWNSANGKILKRSMEQGDLPDEWCRNIRGAKDKVFSGLIPYIRRSDDADEDDESNGEDSPPVCNGYYWTLQKQWLLKRYSQATVDSIDKFSTRVFRKIAFSSDEKRFRKMGLVLGQVQSGKTSNYSALIAKACDAGYKMVIVLSGIHNDLRKQTQERLDEVFLGYHDYLYHEENGKLVKGERIEKCGVSTLPEYIEAKEPGCATYTDDDFRGTLKRGLDRKSPLLFVIKKNSAVFKKFLGYLGVKPDQNKYKDWPLLLIDDEADQASINTKKSTANGDIASVTNDYIRKLLRRFPKATFVGYTATPFANILIDARVDSPKLGIDLFPRDFLVRIPAPTNYFGPAQFFGDNRDEDGLQLFIPVSDRSSDILTAGGSGRKKRLGGIGAASREQELPEECGEALRQFILSTAIRIWRSRRSHPEIWKEQESDDESLEDKPVLESSMLVHFSSRVHDQDKIAQRFRDLVEEEIRNVVEYGDEESRARLKDKFKQLFEAQRLTTNRLASTMQNSDFHPLYPDWKLPADFEEVTPLIEEVVDELAIVVVNGKVRMHHVLERAYRAPERQTIKAQIFIGGNKLSRGLTLPGLCVSFFLRSSTMYDTLLQMGRWFGYRDGYIDLCRICTTTKIIDRFRAISEACLDLESQIDRMSVLNRTPENFRLKILSHTGLLVTARNKLGFSDEAKISFNGETLEFRNLDLSADGLVSNFSRARDLFRELSSSGAELAYASDDYPNQIDDESDFLLEGKKPFGRLWRKVPPNVVLSFLKGFRGQDNEGDQYKKGVVKYIEESLEKNELTDWNVFIPGEFSREEKFFNLKFIKRHMSIPKSDPSSGVMRILKTGGHEYVGVSIEVMRKARELVEEDGKRKLFMTVREVSGQMRPQEGFLILYLMNEPVEGLSDDLYFRQAEEEIGGPVPVVSFYLWLPKSKRNSQTSMARFNMTIENIDPDDEYEVPEMEGEE